MSNITIANETMQDSSDTVQLMPLSRADLPITLEPPTPIDSPINEPRNLIRKNLRWHGRGTRGATSVAQGAKSAVAAFFGAGSFAAAWWFTYNVAWSDWSDMFGPAAQKVKVLAQAFITVGTPSGLIYGVYRGVGRAFSSARRTRTGAPRGAQVASPAGGGAQPSRASP